MQSSPKSDLMLSGLLIFLGAAVLFEAKNIPRPVFESFGAHPVPVAVAWCIIVLSLVLGAKALLRMRTEASEPTSLAAFMPGPTFLVLLALVGEAAAFTWLSVPYVAASWILATTVAIILGGLNKRNIIVSVVLGGILAVGTYLLFTYVFLLDLP